MPKPDRKAKRATAPRRDDRPPRQPYPRKGGPEPAGASPASPSIAPLSLVSLSPHPGYSFELDQFQIDALAALDAGHSVLVAAPTGSGKTVVAEHAIGLALAQGVRAFYTTPIKALSNQKFNDLARRHGAHNVGLLTGDNVINGDAPIVVMTTEVLRNMIYAAPAAAGSGPLASLGWVILDEVHYLQDAYRGPVWEEVIIHAPPNVRLVCLSATVSNAEELAEWVSLVRPVVPCDVVVEHQRPVHLEHLFLAAERGSDRLHLIPTLVDGQPNSEGRRFDATASIKTRGKPAGRARPRFATPRRVEVIDELAALDLVPAIYFIFSRAACDDAVTACVAAGVRLTSRDEALRIRAIAEEHTRNLADGDLTVLGYDQWLSGLTAGIASHHAGMVPPFKEAVEACFALGLVKVVFATETLALGVNMPARTVVIEKLSKYNGERHEFLTAGEYTQLTGRAGRRGIDPVGHAVVAWSPFVKFEEVAGLASSRSFTLRSAFRPTYNMAANLVRRYDEPEAVRLLNRSFAQYQADRTVVRMERRIDDRRADLQRLRDALPIEETAVSEYRAMRREAEAASTPDAAARRAIETALARLAPGAVVRYGPRGGEPVVILSVAQRRTGTVRVRGLTGQRRMLLLQPEGFEALPRLLVQIELPRPFQPYERSFQDEVVRRLRRSNAGVGPPASGQHDPAMDTEDFWGETGDVASEGGDNGDPDAEAEDREERWLRFRDQLWADVEQHPVHQHPQREAASRLVHRIDRAQREIDELQRTVDGVGDTVARRFRRLLDLLVRWGHLKGWNLTERGALLARCYHECDLLVVEALSDGLFDGLNQAELAALLSCLTYEHRSRTAPPQSWLPSAATRDSYRKLQRLAERLAEDEQRGRLTTTRPPDATFAGLAYAWASGSDLDVVLEDEELSGGDFVRNIKQLVDLCRQIGELAPVPATARAARQAAENLFRGVVAASAVIEADVPEATASDLSGP